MATTADIVCVGSGHNGLVATAYLAAAGKKVLVLERNGWFGGGVVTRELTVPGFRHDQHSMAHIFIQANPLLLNDDLRLKARYGLRYVFPELPMMSVFEDGTTLGLYRDRERTYAEIARFSRRDAAAGQLSRYPLVGVGSLTQFDNTRAPAGKAIAHIWDYAPYRRRDGRSWDESKGEFAERMLSHVGRFVASPDVIAYHCDSPVDMERTSPSFLHGDLHGIATTVYQSGSHRPTPDLGQYTVPGIERFYLVGPFQYPGGGVFGAGRATAMRMFEDLGLDFDKQGRVR